MTKSLSPHELATIIARDIMELGDEPDRPATRIEFKSGPLDSEIAQGGLCESALVKFIETSLTKIFESDILTPAERAVKKVLTAPNSSKKQKMKYGSALSQSRKTRFR